MFETVGGVEGGLLEEGIEEIDGEVLGIKLMNEGLDEISTTNMVGALVGAVFVELLVGAMLLLGLLLKEGIFEVYWEGAKEEPFIFFIMPFPPFPDLVFIFPLPPLPIIPFPLLGFFLIFPLPDPFPVPLPIIRNRAFSPI